MSESETNPKTESEKKEEPTKTVSDEKAAEGEEDIGKIKYFMGLKFIFQLLCNHWAPLSAILMDDIKNLYF